MLPVYDPKSFSSIDLRKYHIRDIKDVIRFHEFVTSRMEECQFVLKKMNTKVATFEALSRQMQKKQEEQQAAYGNPNYKTSEPTESVIQTIPDENKSLEEEHQALLDDIKHAEAEQSLQDAVQEAEDVASSERIQAEFDRYKAIDGKYRVMYWRDGKMVSDKDVPEDIKETLLKIIEEKRGGKS